MNSLEETDNIVKLKTWYKGELEDYEIFETIEYRKAYMEFNQIDPLARGIYNLLKTMSREPEIYNNLTDIKIEPYVFTKISPSGKEEEYIGFAFYQPKVRKV